jgi:hypothetical protein
MRFIPTSRAKEPLLEGQNPLRIEKEKKRYWRVRFL